MERIDTGARTERPIGLYILGGFIAVAVIAFFTVWSLPDSARTQLLYTTQDYLPDSVQRANRLQWYAKSEEKIAALTHRDMERAAQQDLLAVLRLIDGGKVAVSAKTGRASAAAMRRIAEVLAGGDFYEIEEPGKRRRQAPGPVRAFAWPWLMQSGRLAARHGPKLELTKAGRQALGLPPAETLRLLWQRWTKSKLLDEFSRIDVFKGQASPTGKRAMTSPASRRAVVGSAVRDCPVGSWVSVDEFWRYMRAADYDFEVTSEPWRLYIIDPYYGTLNNPVWSMIQGRYVSCLLLEYAATLGMIDVAITPPAWAREDFTDYWGVDELDYLSRYDGLWHFRLNALGAYCLGLADQYQPSTAPSQGAVTVFPDRRLRTAGELSFDEKLLLELYAKAIRETGGGALAVSDDEMVRAMYTLASTEGIIACPEGAATLVGLERLLADGSIGADEEVVLLNTGSGYKYLDLLAGPGE